MTTNLKPLKKQPTSPSLYFSRCTGQFGGMKITGLQSLAISIWNKYNVYTIIYIFEK